MTQPADAPALPKRSFQWRIVLLLLVLIAAISSAVLLADRLSPRRRQAVSDATSQGKPQ